MRSHEDKSISVSLILSWENGKLSLWSHENAILHLDGSQVQELERKRTAAQTKAVVSSAAESGCLDISVEMSASDSSPV